MRRRCATVAKPGEWQCKITACGGPQWRMGPTFFEFFLYNASCTSCTPIHQVSLAVLSRAACASMSTTTTTDNDDDDDNAWQRGPLWPHKMGPIKYSIKVYLARSANLPEGLYNLPPFLSYFLYIIFFNDFSETNYLKIRQTDFRKLYVEWKLLGRRWSIWTSFFDISRYFAMATDFVQKWAKLPTPLHLSLCHSETVWAIVLRMSALKAQLIALYSVKNDENRFSSFWVKPG